MKILIIGAVAAGSKVAAKSKRLLPNSEIHIYTKDTHVSYSACGIPYYIEGNFTDWKKLLVRTAEQFEQSGIHVHTCHKVVEIIPGEKRIKILNLKTNEVCYDNYDKLVISTGAEPFMPEFPKINLKNIFTLRNLDDGINIKNQMLNSNNITIIGGGYISIELIEAFVKNNKNVTIIERSNYMLSNFDDDVASLIQNYILENSNNLVKIINNDVVTEFIGEDKVTGVLTKEGQGFETDMVVICAGIRPIVDIAKNAGIQLGKTGAIKVNSRMETNIPDIYACGDCTEKINIISNTPVWIPLGSTANKEGRVAAINLCGGVEDYEGVLGSSVTRYLGLNISMTGLSEKYAQKLGYDTVSTLVTKPDKASYMPNVENITLKLIADKRSHKVLGAQAIGSNNADKKVNIISVGLMEKIDIETLLDVDFTYAPPISTTEDIIHLAARKIKKELG